MSTNIYLRAVGESTGPLNGSVTQEGRADLIEVYEVDQVIESPRDRVSGMPTGKRVHGPIRLRCALDKATPLLYSVLTNNENLTEVEILFWRPSRTGVEDQFYTIQLENASISKMTLDSPNLKDPDMGPLPDMVIVEMVYQKIIWTWNDGGITAEDDWETPRV